MDIKNLSIDEIIAYCQEHNEVEWLKKVASETIECEVYPRKTIIDENGKKKSVADKSKEPKIVKRPITFIQIKVAFCEKFGFASEKKPKEPTMYERIAAL